MNLSVIIPAYNEEVVIVRKLDDIFATGYDRSRFEVLVGSDGSTDRTAELAREYGRTHATPSLRVFEFANEGKAATLDKLATECRGEIVLGTDADSVFENPGLLAHLAVRFESDPLLGGISCVPVFATNAVEQGYWRAEHAVRAFLSLRGSLFVVTGMGFAFRKKAVDPVPRDIMADDLWLPLSILKNGYTVVSDDVFRARTGVFADERELTRKIRVMKGGMQCLLRFFAAHPRMLVSPVFGWVALFKISKWLLPVGFAGAFILLAALSWKAAVIVGGGGLVAALVNGSVRYLIMGLFVPVVAFWQAALGSREARWMHVR